MRFRALALAHIWARELYIWAGAAHGRVRARGMFIHHSNPSNPSIIYIK